jgi:hypothetical protein
VPGLVVITWYWMAVPVIVIEGISGQEAMDRSKSLSEGSRWPILGIALVLGVLAILVAIALTAVLAVAGLGARGGLSPLGNLLLEVLNVPVLCLGAVAPAVGYHALRAGKEGVDLEELLSVFE